MQQTSFFDTAGNVAAIAQMAGFDGDRHRKMLAELTDTRPPVSLVGYRVPLVMKHLQWHLEQEPPKQPNHRDKRICTVDCMARAMYQISTSAHRQKIRERMPKLANQCLDWGMFLVLQYEPRGAGRRRIVSMKLAQPTDHFRCDEQIRRMVRREQLTAERAIVAREIVDRLGIATGITGVDNPARAGGITTGVVDSCGFLRGTAKRLAGWEGREANQQRSLLWKDHNHGAVTGPLRDWPLLSIRTISVVKSRGSSLLCLSGHAGRPGV